MLSRLKYRGYCIDYYPDECGQPLPDVAESVAKAFKAPKAEASILRSSNRFQVFANGDSEGNNDNEVEEGEKQQRHGADRCVPALSLESW
jgi:hypothetical protein